MVESAFRSVVAACLVAVLGGCTTQPPSPDPETSKRNLVMELESETVAFVHKDDDGDILPYCAGVWVGRRHVLTAAHCMSGEHDIAMMTASSAYGVSEPLVPGVLLREDVRTDLALVETVIDPPPHRTSRLALHLPYPGDVAHVVGHTTGYLWTYTVGTVAAVRRGAQGPRGTKLTALQVSAFVWFGNSGGGVWNKSGDLMGISSWVSVSAPGLAFFVSSEEIRKFLVGPSRD